MNCGQERGVTWHHDPSSPSSNPRTCELCALLLTHATQSKSVQQVSGEGRTEAAFGSCVPTGSTDDLRAHPFQCPFPPTVLLNNSGAKGTWNCSILLEFGDPASWCLTGLQSRHHSRLLITLLLGQAPWERCFCQSWFPKIQWWGREGTAALLSSDLRMCARVCTRTS